MLGGLFCPVTSTSRERHSWGSRARKGNAALEENGGALSSPPAQLHDMEIICQMTCAWFLFFSPTLQTSILSEQGSFERRLHLKSLDPSLNRNHVVVQQHQRHYKNITQLKWFKQTIKNIYAMKLPFSYTVTVGKYKMSTAGFERTLKTIKYDDHVFLKLCTVYIK